MYTFEEFLNYYRDIEKALWIWNVSDTEASSTTSGQVAYLQLGAVFGHRPPHLPPHWRPSATEWNLAVWERVVRAALARHSIEVVSESLEESPPYDTANTAELRQDWPRIRAYGYTAWTPACASEPRVNPWDEQQQMYTFDEFLEYYKDIEKALWIWNESDTGARGSYEPPPPCHAD